MLATLLIGGIFGAYRHYVQMRALGLGRAGYLDTQARWFDKVSGYHATGTMLIAGVIVAAVAVGLYELVAAGFTRLIPPSEIEE